MRASEFVFSCMFVHVFFECEFVCMCVGAVECVCIITFSPCRLAHSKAQN